MAPAALAINKPLHMIVVKFNTLNIHHVPIAICPLAIDVILMTIDTPSLH